MSQIIVQSQKAGLPLQFLQLGGMIRYELVRYWRRRGLPLVLLLWAITIVGYIFFMTQDETLFESVSLFNQSPILH
ncbi:MAG: hypothetical protein GY943_35605, partial [Chloroflexi bacterium]|nr:hypothetical protein [Chloroflexota bacterium]